MATLVKEKKRGRKSKRKADQNAFKTENDNVLPKEFIDSEVPSTSGENKINSPVPLGTKEDTPSNVENIVKSDFTTETFETKDDEVPILNQKETNKDATETSNVKTYAYNFDEENDSQSSVNITTKPITESTTKNDTNIDFKNLKSKLELLSLPSEIIPIPDGREADLKHPEAYLKPEPETIDCVVENVEPSAPMIELPIPNAPIEEVIEISTKLPCMSLKEAIEFYNGKEIAAIKAISEREEAIVEAGPLSGPDHPLVDLLTTFRTSIMAFERERILLQNSYDEEKKCRKSLWTTTKKFKLLSQACKCGEVVTRKVSFDYSEFDRDRLPLAKMRLEKFTKDVQECYCHYQHVALRTYNEIEILLSDIFKKEKSDIREALFLILQALKLSSGAPDILPAVLIRWAGALSNELGHADNTDICHLLFLLHLLFRQTRSVQWAASAIAMSVKKEVDAAHVLAVLDILLNHSKVENTGECNEDLAESWEEVCLGGAGAVSEGTLRERDMLALINALPLSDMIASILCLHTIAPYIYSTYRDPNTLWGDDTGGKLMLKSCCGVRTLISCLRARPHYVTLRARLAQLAAAALKGLAYFYQGAREPYEDDYIMKIHGEMEACFAEAFILFDKEDLTNLTTAVLTDNTARDYCLNLIVGLHETVPKRLISLDIVMPVLPCEIRVRIVTQAAIDRAYDLELTNIVMDFLFQVGIRKKIATCKGSCDTVAKESLSLLIKERMYLLPVALRTMAGIGQVEQVDPALLKYLLVNKWRPTCNEFDILMMDWMQKCPVLMPHLILSMDYTPFTGVDLETQIHIGSCLRDTAAWSGTEWRWTALRALRPHRACWQLPLQDAPAPSKEPTTLFDKAFALIATSWGHNIPLICSVGVSALLELSRTRAVDAAHVAATVMLVMADSPESIFHTPAFAEVVSALGNQSPSFISRAFGRGGVSGTELLQRLIIAQADAPFITGVSVFPAWLSAAWGRAVADNALGTLAALDTAALLARDYTVMDDNAKRILQASNPSAVVRCCVRAAFSAPLLCEVVVRTWHTLYEMPMLSALRQALAFQRRNGNKIHIDNALQKIGSRLTSEELAIYRVCAAGLAAPASHPAHLLLWRLFFHIYLQRTMDTQCDIALGPLFFSGMIKYRTLGQIKKKLQETAVYHNTEAANWKTKADKVFMLETSTAGAVKKPPTRKQMQAMFPPLQLIDLTDSFEEDSNASEDNHKLCFYVNGLKQDEYTRLMNMHVYHCGAERLVQDYIGWLEAGDEVVAVPQHADLGRLIPDYALKEAWNFAVSNLRPTPSAELDNFPEVVEKPQNETITEKEPVCIAYDIIRATRTSRIPKESHNFYSEEHDVNVNCKKNVLECFEEHFAKITRSSEEWKKRVECLESLDSELWKDVEKLKESQPIPPIRKHCSNNCTEPVVLIVKEFEYITNKSAVASIEENRKRARVDVMKLCNARPHLAHAVALLQYLVRRIKKYDIAYSVMELTWRTAGYCDGCSIVKDTFIDIFTFIAENWITSNGQLCADLIEQWCDEEPNSLQQTMIGALISPTADDCKPLYEALLEAALPHHTIFSYLSKFDMGKIMQEANKYERQDFIATILKSIQQYGAKPSESYYMVLELLGMHAGHIVTPHVLPEFITKICIASYENKVPPSFWVHVIKIATDLAGDINFDQMGHLLRSIGSVWAQKKDPEELEPYAFYVASLLHVLMSAFVETGIDLSYEPSRVGWYAWGALLEAWTPWIATTGPLAFMLQHFVDGINRVMSECPGSEVKILQLVFEWAIQVQAKTPLLTELKRLPWDEHQWASVFCIQISLQQMTDTSGSEWCEWIYDRWRCTTAETLVSLVAPDQLPAHLANLLQLFTTAVLPPQVTEEATRLPWWHLPEQQFGEILDNFFYTFDNATVPYHEIPQFRMFLYASEVRPLREAGSDAAAKRTRLISSWTAASAQPPHKHAITAHTLHILQLLTQLAPHLQPKEQMEDLVSRAMVIFCTEPGGTDTIQLWCDWIASAPYECVRATVVASASLTVAKYAAKLADVAVKTILRNYEEGWDWLISVWRGSCWPYSTTYLCRAAPLAAYCCVNADAHASQHVATLLALNTACKINYVEDEIIVAVWICFACRVGYECLRTLSPEELSSECQLPAVDVESPEVPPPPAPPAASLLAARLWLRTLALSPKRSLLKMITLQVNTEVHTPQHRLLATFALCVIDQNQENVSDYQSQCSSLLGANNQFSSWGKSANLTQLLALASHLYPNKSKYFQKETEHVKRIEGTSH